VYNQEEVKMNVVSGGVKSEPIGDVEQRISNLQRSVADLSSVVCDLQGRLHMVLSHDPIPPDENCGNVESQAKCDLSSTLQSTFHDVNVQVKILRSVLDRIQL
jgi:hypothetical protein